MVALTAPDSVTLKVSVGSVTASSVIGTVMVWVTTPGVKVSEPEVAV